MVDWVKTKTWKGVAIVKVDKNLHKRTYILYLADGEVVEVTDKFIETGKGYIEEGVTRDEYNELQDKFDKFKETYKGTIVKTKQAYEDKIKDERRLRTEAEERAEHLQDEVSRLRRELQRRYEQDRQYPIGSVSAGTSGSDGYVLTSGTGEPKWVEPEGTSVSTVPRDSTTSKVPTGW